MRRDKGLTNYPWPLPSLCVGPGTQWPIFCDSYDVDLLTRFVRHQPPCRRATLTTTRLCMPVSLTINSTAGSAEEDAGARASLVWEPRLDVLLRGGGEAGAASLVCFHGHCTPRQFAHSGYTATIFHNGTISSPSRFGVPSWCSLATPVL